MATKPKGKFRSVRKKADDVDIKSNDLIPSRNRSQSEHRNKAKNTNISYPPIPISPKSPSRSSDLGTRDYLRINGPLSYPPHSHNRNPSQSVMVRLKRLDTLRLNQRIKVKDRGYGTIQFLGCVHFAQGLFVGVQLDEANGKHDGSYHGKRYFTAKEKHGVLVKQHRVELLDVVDTQNQQNNNIGLNDDEFNQIFDDFMDENKNKNNNKSSKSSLTSFGNEMIINELKASNKALNEKIEEYISSMDDVEIKWRLVEKENMELKEEKLHYENEMNNKIEELEQELQQIRIQLNTKDEVLKKQISNHENTKNKFRKKIREHEELKQKNQDTVQLILYGDNLKDELINEYKKKEKKYSQEKQEYLLEMERVNIATQQKLNKAIEEWIFDYGDGGHLLQ